VWPSGVRWSIRTVIALDPIARSGRPRRLCGLLAVCIVGVTAPAWTGERVRVRADAAFGAAGLVPEEGGARATGTLRDDVGSPIADAEVILSGDAASLLGAQACTAGSDIGRGGVRSTHEGVATLTDAQGRFCVKLAAPPPDGALTVHYSGDSLRGEASARLATQRIPGTVRLAFDAPRLVASLDVPSARVAVSTRTEGSGTGTPIRLVLSQGPGPVGPPGQEQPPGPEQELAAADVVVGAVARFDVETRLLGGPGPSRLTVRFPGSAALSAASEWVHVDRVTTVHLALAGTVAPANPSRGAELHLAASSSAGPAPDGWVEAVVNGQPAGVAPVERGAARLSLTLPATRRDAVVATVRYVPESPGWVPGPEGLAVTIPIAGPSTHRLAPWLLGAAAIAYVVLRAWRRPPRAIRSAARPHEAAPGRAVVELVRAAPGHSGWQGTVTDAHEGTPVAGARVNLVVPVFDGEGVAATVTTPEDGSFTLPPIEAGRSAGARLVVAAPHHATLTEPLPRDGVLSICLVGRRRALLDRLVAWTTQAGRPFARKAEPTPHEVAQVARRERREDVEAWASAVNEAAFGPSPPDERADEALRRAEPPAPAPDRSDR